MIPVRQQAILAKLELVPFLMTKETGRQTTWKLGFACRQHPIASISWGRKGKWLSWQRERDGGSENSRGTAGVYSDFREINLFQVSTPFYSSHKGEVPSRRQETGLQVSLGEKLPFSQVKARLNLPQKKTLKAQKAGAVIWKPNETSQLILAVKWEEAKRETWSRIYSS